MNSGRLVVVSNRLPTLKRNQEGRVNLAPAAGGLVTALLPALQAGPRSLWMGWSGKSSKRDEASPLRRIETPLVEFIEMDLSERDVEAYYNGFCNRTIWPLFHCFQGRVRMDRNEQARYFKVNERFARALIQELRPGDMVWVHDYHLIPLGMFLRRHGFDGPLGFFLHIPFPPLEMIEILPDAAYLLRAMLAYDLVGFHTERYAENYFESAHRLQLAERRENSLTTGRHRQRVTVVPIGINPPAFAPGAAAPGPSRKRVPARPSDCQIILGVDRLDYTKGIPERIVAMEQLLKRYPKWRRKVVLIQICSPSRTRVKEYIEQKKRMDQLVGRVNGEFSLPDWEPIRYLHRTYSQNDLVSFYHDADVMLVTPLRDGMNLVAMEFVAAQGQDRPGALVLSRYAGLAEYLPDAIQVNPYLPVSVAEGIHQALSMNRSERKKLHRAMMEFIVRNTSQRWAQIFIAELAAIGRRTRRPLPAFFISPQPPADKSGPALRESSQRQSPD